MMMEFSFFHLQLHTHTHTVPGEGQMRLERGTRERLLQSQQLVSDPAGRPRPAHVLQGLDRSLRPKAFHSSANLCSRPCWQDRAWHRAEGGLSKARMAGQPGGQTNGWRRERPGEQERQGFGPASTTSLAWRQHSPNRASKEGLATWIFGKEPSTEMELLALSPATCRTPAWASAFPGRSESNYMRTQHQVPRGPSVRASTAPGEGSAGCALGTGLRTCCVCTCPSPLCAWHCSERKTPRAHEQCRPAWPPTHPPLAPT